jgi:hypothetical protein
MRTTPKLSVFVAGVLLVLAPWSAMALEVGNKAPDFSLPSTGGGKISLILAREVAQKP